MYLARLIPICFVMTLVLLCGKAGAARIDVALGFESSAMGPGVAYLEDPSGQLHFSDVAKQATATWRHTTTPIPTLGYSASAFWFQFDVRNVGQGEVSTLLEVAYPMLNQVDVYLVRQDGTVWSYQLGSFQPVSQRMYPHRNFIVPVDLPYGEALQVYLRVKTTSSIQVPVTMWSPQAFLIQDNAIHILYGAYLGLVVIMFAYNLKLFVGTRDRNYLYYITWVTSMAGFVMSIQGLSMQFVWPGQVQLNDHILILFVVCVITSALMFSSHFLQVRQAMPHRLRWMLVLNVLNTAMAVASFVLPYNLMIRLSMLSSLVMTAVVGQMSLQRWWQGYKPARYFAVSWALVLLGGVAMTMSKFGLIGRTVWTEHSLTIGSALEIVLLNLALADRFNGERRARTQAQLQLLEWQQKHNEVLEAKVTQRTQELELANWQLKQYVSRMSRLQMGSELGAGLIHELRQPLAAIQSFAQGGVTLMERAVDTYKLKTVLGRIVDTAKKGNVMLDRMRAFLVQDTEAFKPFNLNESVLAAMVWLRPTCAQEGVQLNTDGVQGDLMAQGDNILTQQIIVNLLRNAVDAMQSAGTAERSITVSTFQDGGWACCRVVDSGPGLPPAVRDKLFETYFTTKADGLGLGLKLSRSIAQEMRGDLTIESPSVGASFLLLIPLSKHAVASLSAS